MLLNFANWVYPILNMVGIMMSNSGNTSQEIAPLFLTSSNRDMRFVTTKLPIQNDTEGVSEKPRNRGVTEKALGFTAFFSLAVVGITGNGLVIYAIFTDSAVQIKTQLSNLAILNLAYTDLMTTSIVCLPAALSIWFDHYPLGSIFCRIWSVFNLTGIVATMGLLSVISVDRFVAVGWSLHYPQYVTYNRLLAGISYVWISTFACTLCWALFDCEYDFVSGVCDFTWQRFGPKVPSAFYYGAFCTLVFCLIPSGAILFCNLGIIQMSKGQGSRVGKIQDSEGGKGKQESAKVNARILKAMVIVIVSYFLLTFPVAFIRVVKVLSGPDGPAKYIPGWLTLICTFLQFSASIVNPLIYGLFRKDFRESYARIWKRISGKG